MVIGGTVSVGTAKVGTRKKKCAAMVTSADGEGEIAEEQTDKESRLKFTKRDYELMCEWLKLPENLASVGGTDGKTKVGGRYRNRKQAFQALGTFIMANQLLKSLLRNVPGESARNRWSYQMLRYKKAKPEIESTGFGLSAEDEGNGIMTLEAKMEHMCSCYERFDAIYGARPAYDFNKNMYSTPRAEGDAEHRPWDQRLPQSPNEDAHSVDESEQGQEWLNLDTTTEQTQNSPLPQDAGANVEQPPATQDQPLPDSGVHIPDLTEPATPLGNPLPTTPEGNPPPTTPQGNPPPTRTQGNAAPTPPGDASISTSQAARQSASKAAEKKETVNPSLYPGRKRALDKSQSLVGALAASMESQALGKGQSNEVKQKGLDLHFSALQQDRELREQTAMKERTIAMKRLRMEEKKLQEDAALAKEKFQQEAEIARAKLKQDAESTKVQAIIQIINSNTQRSPAEIAELLQMMDRAM